MTRIVARASAFLNSETRAIAYEFGIRPRVGFRYRDEMRADPHKPLRDDVRLMGELRGDTLRTHEGEAVFETVERVRALAKRARTGHNGQLTELAELLAHLPIDRAFTVARAFAHFLNLANIAEQHHRTRRRRAYLRDRDAQPQRGSCQETFTRLIAGGVPPTRLWEAVCTLRIQLVLTAHPTEVARRTLIHKHNRIAGVLEARDRPDLTLPDAQDLVNALHREIVAAWGTKEVRDRRATPMDEVRSGLIVFEQSLWDALPRYMRAVDGALISTTGRGLPLDAAPIRFGSWIGGDRDGNPSVTPHVTRDACLLARRIAAKLYLQELDALRAELSMHRASQELRDRVGDVAEPYRVLLGQVRTRLESTREWLEASLDGVRDVDPPADVLLDADQLADPLRLCYRSLETTGNRLIAEGRLTDLLRRTAVFGLTLAELDIRQEACQHTATLDAITRALDLGSYAEWDEARRTAFLVEELQSKRPLIPARLDAGAAVRDVLETFRTLARIHPASLGAYVITMTSRTSDVLAVELLQKEAGIDAPLRVVPLFEMSRDLQHAGAIVERLLEIPWYRTHIGHRLEVTDASPRTTTGSAG